MRVREREREGERESHGNNALVLSNALHFHAVLESLIMGHEAMLFGGLYGYWSGLVLCISANGERFLSGQMLV